MPALSTPSMNWAALTAGRGNLALSLFTLSYASHSLTITSLTLPFFFKLHSQESGQCRLSLSQRRDRINFLLNEHTTLEK